MRTEPEERTFFSPFSKYRSASQIICISYLDKRSFVKFGLRLDPKFVTLQAGSKMTLNLKVIQRDSKIKKPKSVTCKHSVHILKLVWAHVKWAMC